MAIDKPQCCLLLLLCERGRPPQQRKCLKIYTFQKPKRMRIQLRSKIFFVVIPGAGLAPKFDIPSPEYCKMSPKFPDSFRLFSSAKDESRKKTRGRMKKLITIFFHLFFFAKVASFEGKCRKRAAAIFFAALLR